MQIGGSADAEIDTIAEQWRLFKKHHPGEIERHKEVAVPLINSLVRPPKYLQDLDSIEKYLTNLFERDSDSFQKIATITLKLRAPIEMSIRRLFFVWKGVIEGAMQEYASQNRIVLEEISDASTSSPLIYYMMWDRENSPVKRPEIFKKFQYDYRGYCPMDALARLRLLLEFPIGQLLALLKRPMIGDIKALHDAIRDSITVHKFRRPNCRIEGASGVGVKCLMDHFVDAYQSIRDFLDKKEAYYVELAQRIDDVAGRIEASRKY